MQFHVYEVPRKKGSIVHLHTPSCKQSTRLREKGSPLWKIEGQYLEDAQQNFVLNVAKQNGMPVVVHTTCCDAFKKPSNTNPPCMHCSSPDTQLREKLAPGQYEYGCRSCKKTFVVKKEKVMKIKIRRNGKQVKAKMTADARKQAREQKRSDRLAAREQRRADRKQKRAGRLALRIYKMVGRLGLLVDIDGAIAESFLKEIASKTNTPNPVTGKTAKTKAAKAAKTRKSKKAAPLKKVAYNPMTNKKAVKTAAKKSSRKK